MGIGGIQTGMENPYKYNGKELTEDFGLQWYNYGFRHYDPQLGRWHAVDPLASSTPALSPYVYAFNDPVNNIDVAGLYGRNVHPWYTDGRGGGSTWGGLRRGGTSGANALKNPIGTAKGNVGPSRKQVDDSFKMAPLYGGSFSASLNATMNGYSINPITGERQRKKYLGQIQESAEYEIVNPEEKVNVTHSTNIISRKVYIYVSESEGNDATINDSGTGLRASGLGDYLGAGSFLLGASGYHIGNHMKSVSRFGPLYWNNGTLYRPALSGYRYGILSGRFATKLGAGLRLGGNMLGGLGIAYTGYQMYQGEISGVKGSFNIGFGIIGFFGPIGMGVSAIYYVGDTFIPGGWEATPQHMYDQIQRNSVNGTWISPYNHFK